MGRPCLAQRPGLIRAEVDEVIHLRPVSVQPGLEAQVDLELRLSSDLEVQKSMGEF